MIDEEDSTKVTDDNCESWQTRHYASTRRGGKISEDMRIPTHQRGESSASFREPSTPDTQRVI